MLKSWAIPKGPSLDPRDKRLAIATEDHPLDYATFEGAIPEGQYGGGNVLLWDRGNWSPEGDVESGLREGKLSFELAGEKLHGRFSLVRLARAKGSQWLLVKGRDEHARHGSVTETEPKSVLSGRSLGEVAAAGSARTRSAKARRTSRSTSRSAQPHTSRTTTKQRRTKSTASLPSLVSMAKPELATLVKTPPSGDGWLHEMKFDGYRILAAVVDGKAKLLSRNGKDWTERLPDIAKAVEKLPCTSALLDGEVAVELADGRTSFQALQRLLREGNAKPTYYVFDLLHLDGRDLRDEPLVSRKKALKTLVENADAALRFSEHVDGRGADFFQHACQLRLEGAVSKRADSTYRAGRGKDWVKTKCGSRQELVIGGYTDLAGQRPNERIGALLLGVNDEEGFVYAGRVGTGFTDATRRELRTKLGKLERKTPAFSNPPKTRAGVHWVRPALVAEVDFTEWTKDGRLRHPAFLGLREDKRAPEIVREAPTEPPKLHAAPRLTHPDRVLFPGRRKVTKRELAEYYTSVTEQVLPELRDRPVAIVRCPSGAESHCFFQRHPGKGVPATLRRVEIAEGTGKNEYLVLDALPDLLELVQLGALELHTWAATVDDLERPDRLTFDLDPSPRVPWTRTLAAARLVRDRLSKLGLTSFVKTTGGKGLHVVVPLIRGASWEECNVFARDVARALVEERPTWFVAEASKTKRSGRVFIDYLRNARGATTVVSYSTRARRDAPVATPLAWSELTSRLRPAAFNVHTVPERVQRTSPWSDFERARCPLPKAQ